MAGGFRLRRRHLLAALAGSALAGPAALAATRTTPTLAGDFDLAYRELASRYAYPDASRAALRIARDAWRPRAAKAKTPEELAVALAGLVAGLRDEHVTLDARGEHPQRRVPSETDIWATWREGAAYVEAVRVSGEADLAGLRPGHVVRNIQGVAIDRAVARFAGADRSPAARDWALRKLLAGPWAGTFRLDVTGEDGQRRLEIERRVPAPANTPPMAGRRIGEKRDLGYLRIRNALDDPGLVSDVDAALANVREMRALILDLRDLSGPGSHEVTRALLGRFIDREAPWQVRVDHRGAKAADAVAPRGPRLPMPIVALVDRWTAGEGEALAGGLAATAGARLIGTPMAGLRGELAEVKLPASGVMLRFPAQKVLMPDGTPREKLLPAIAVDLAAPSGGPGDPILYQALKALS